MPKTGPLAGTKIRQNPIDGAEMVWIQPGRFRRGTDPEEIDRLWRKFGWPEESKQSAKDEAPAHEVALTRGFWLYRHEVTVAQYRRFCQAKGRPMPAAPEWGWIERHPVVNVSWDDAKAYCDWAQARLPSEAEWERAARGRSTGVGGTPRHVFVWGDALPKGNERVGNLADESWKEKYKDGTVFAGYDDGFVHTAPVGSFKENGYRLHDMAGNVAEWCADWYAEDYYGKGPRQDPEGPQNGNIRVVRGAMWISTPYTLRAADRNRNAPASRNDRIGFRCARTE